MPVSRNHSDRNSMARLVCVRVAVCVSVVMLAIAAAQAQEPAVFTKQHLAPSVASLDSPPTEVDIVNVLHYDLSLSLAMTEELMGGRVDIRAVMKPFTAGLTDRIVLHAAQLQIDSASIDGHRCTVVRDSAAEQIALVAPSGVLIAPGDTVMVRIDYRRLAGVKRPGGRWGYYYFKDSLGIPANLGYTMSEPSDARFWLPCHDDPSDKATADFHITVPEGYMAVCNGKLLGSDVPEAGKVRWHWRERHVLPPYLMAVTASKFTVPTQLLIRAVGDTIPLQYYVWAPDSAKTAAYLDVVQDMVTGLSAVYGPYPFDKYGMVCVVPFSYGGMEHQSITTMNRYLETDERVVVHELAHQWWGDLVTCATWPDIWLNESFATYSEAIWEELNGGKAALQSYMVNNLQHFYYGSWQGSVYDPEGQGFNLFDDVVYSKGAWVLHTMRGAIGDSAFFRTLRAYRAEYAGGNATTAQFKAVVDSVVGTSMTWFFDAWVYGPGWPAYNVRREWLRDTLRVTITQTQSAAWPVFPAPLELRLRGAGRDTTVSVWNDARTSTYTFTPGFVVDSVLLDPSNRVMKTATYARTTDVQEEPVPGTFALEQNYPNPFNGTTMIRFTIGDGAGARVRLRLYDVLGREVSVILDEHRAAGEHRVTFDASRLASGVYLYTLDAGGRRLTRPMVLIR